MEGHFNLGLASRERKIRCQRKKKQQQQLWSIVSATQSCKSLRDSRGPFPWTDGEREAQRGKSLVKGVQQVGGQPWTAPAPDLLTPMCGPCHWAPGRGVLAATGHQMPTDTASGSRVTLASNGAPRARTELARRPALWNSSSQEAVVAAGVKGSGARMCPQATQLGHHGRANL